MLLQEFVKFFLYLLCVSSASGFFNNFNTSGMNSNPFVNILRDAVKNELSVTYNRLVKSEYDYVIVGAGPAGCVLANRLSEDRNVKVLLLEAGESELVAFTDAMIGSAYLQATTFNWGFQTEAQGRACQGMIDRRCRFPHGRGVGGSSIINYGIYTRGNQRDFNRWYYAGNRGWSYEDVLPYFKKSEEVHLNNYDPIYHGSNGPAWIEDIPFRTNISHAFVRAAQEYGFRSVDYNGEEQIGVSYAQSFTKNGWRFTAAESYIHPILHRKNLDVITKAWVTKLIFNKNDPSKVVGVRYVRNKMEASVKARREVILSAGSFQSPQLLMLSGVGPKQDLEDLGIPVIQDLPVGQLLYEHLGVFGPIYTIDNLNDGLRNSEELFNIQNAHNFIKGRGPLTMNGVESLVYAKTNTPATDCDPNMPDVEIMQTFASVGFDLSDANRLALGISQQYFDQVFRPLSNTRSFAYLIMLLHPKSHGYLKLKSTNPFHNPLFYPNFYFDDRDLKSHVNAIRIAQEITEQQAFRHLGIKKYAAVVPGCEQFEFDTDAYWECYILAFALPLHHQVGTCKMGPASDPMSVVNDQLLVHGYDNLRVVDTSIIPFPISAHTAAFSYMIGEKGADMIKQRWSNEFPEIKANINKRSSRRKRSRFDWQKVSKEEYFKMATTLTSTSSTTTTKEPPKTTKIPSTPSTTTTTTTSTTTTTVKPTKLILDENMSSANESTSRSPAPNASRYGKGKPKPKYISQILSRMKLSESNSEELKHHETTTSAVTATTTTLIESTSKSREKRGLFDELLKDDSQADTKKFLMDSWKDSNDGGKTMSDDLSKLSSDSWKYGSQAIHRKSEFLRSMFSRAFKK